MLALDKLDKHIAVICYPSSLGINLIISLDQNKLFVSESLPPLTQLAKWYKELKKQFSDL